MPRGSQQPAFRVPTIVHSANGNSNGSTTPTPTAGAPAGTRGRKRAAEGQPETQPAARKTRTAWTDEHISYMLKELIELTNLGKMTDNQGFKGPDLVEIAKGLRDLGGDYDFKRIRNKYDDMKKT